MRQQTIIFIHAMKTVTVFYLMVCMLAILNFHSFSHHFLLYICVSEWVCVSFVSKAYFKEVLCKETSILAFLFRWTYLYLLLSLFMYFLCPLTATWSKVDNVKKKSYLWCIDLLESYCKTSNKIVFKAVHYR